MLTDSSLDSDQQLWVLGTAETGPVGIACNESVLRRLRFDPPNCDLVRAQYSKLISNGQYIFRPSTPFAIEWLRIANDILDRKAPLIRRYTVPPARKGRCCFSEWGAAEANYSLHALRWAELHGEIFHPLQLRWLRHISVGLPRWDSKPYV